MQGMFSITLPILLSMVLRSMSPMEAMSSSGASMLPKLMVSAVV